MIVLLGVAGSGKSMQGKLLADEHGYSWISTGEIFRVLVTGKRRLQMLQGKLLSDEEVINMLDKVLELVDMREEVVLDGFPRTVKQADWLIEQSKKDRFKLSGIVHLSSSEDVVRTRLMARGRLDDTEKAITRRFDEYKAVTVPIISHFKKVGIHVYNIDASQTPKAVHDAIIKYVDNNKTE